MFVKKSCIKHAESKQGPVAPVLELPIVLKRHITGFLSFLDVFQLLSTSRQWREEETEMMGCVDPQLMGKADKSLMALARLRNMKRVTSAWIGPLNVPNHLEEFGHKALLGYLQSSFLERLSLTLTDDLAAALVQNLKEPFLRLQCLDIFAIESPSDNIKKVVNFLTTNAPHLRRIGMNPSILPLVNISQLTEVKMTSGGIWPDPPKTTNKSLQSLSVDFSGSQYYPIVTKEFQDWILQCPSLRCLVLKHCLNIHIWKNRLAFPLLETLELESVNLPNVDMQFWTTFKHLKRLRIHYCKNVSDVGVAQLCRTLPGLLEFELVQYTPKRGDLRVRLCLSDLSNIKGLQKLLLTNVILDVYLNWGHGPQFKELKYLALTECGFFTGMDDEVDVGQFLLSLCPNLSTLCWACEGNEALNKGLFQALPRFSTLFHFSYENIKHPEDEQGLEKSKSEISNCSQLRTLAFPGDSLLTAFGSTAFGSSLIELIQRLDVLTVESLGDTNYYDTKLGQILQDAQQVDKIRAIERHSKCLLVRKNTHSFPKGLSNALLDYYLVACHPKNEIGLSFQSVFQAFSKVDKQLIRQTVEQLSENGHLYSTIDEEHFRPTGSA
jgi:hypothetical protein